jgi:hypothetical protein
VKRLRQLGLVLATVVAASFGLLAMPTAQACGCGGFVASDGEEIASTAEYAVLSWDGEQERLLLSMDALATSADGALLIPTPTPAEAALADTSVFEELEELTAPEEVVDYQWWPDLGFGAGSGDAGAAAPGADGVEVLETLQLGDIEVSVLAAKDADELARWLDENGYVMRDNLADALMPYVSEGWYYLAIRLTTEADSLSGALQPLDLTFASDQLIYPMRLSAAATESQFVRTYVFSDHRMQRTDETASNGDSLWFAGPVEPTQVTSDALVSITTEQPYLTVLDQYFEEPSSQILSDFTFARAPTDSEYRQVLYETRMREVLGIPAGPALTFIGMVVVLVLILTISGILRYRRHHRT